MIPAYKKVKHTSLPLTDSDRLIHPPLRADDTLPAERLAITLLKIVVSFCIGAMFGAMLAGGI